MSYTEAACNLAFRAIASCFESKRDLCQLLTSISEEYNVSIVVDVDVDNRSVFVSALSTERQEHTITSMKFPIPVLKYCYKCLKRNRRKRETQ